MKLHLLLAICPLSLSLVSAAVSQEALLGNSPVASAARTASAAKAAAVVSYAKLPLSFEANQGQRDPQVRFASRGDGYSLLLTDSAAILALSKSPMAAPGHSIISPGKRSFNDRRPDAPDILRMEVKGGSRSVQVMGEKSLPGTANYFIGNDPAKWHPNIPTYAKVRYKQIYPGVDLTYYGNQQQLEYDFIIAPGGDPTPVRLHFKGATKLSLDAEGDLTVSALSGNLTFHKPIIYQVQNGQRQLVDGGFRLVARNNVSFQLGNYDHKRELVIDPTLAYSSYLGGASDTSGNAIAVDSSGNAYVTGSASGVGLAVTQKAFQGSPHSTFTAFVSKLNTTGDALLYSTYLGGSEYDFANSIAVDAAGDAFITGAATSTNFPVTDDAYQKVNKGGGLNVYNAFLAKLNPTGTGLVYSTYLGGTGSEYQSGMDELYAGDQGTAIALDKNGNAYVTGLAYSYDFPVTKNAFQSTNNEGMGSASVFVARLNAAGSALVYSTYLGGSFYAGEDRNVRGGTQARSIRTARPLNVSLGDQYPNSQTGGDNGYGIAVDSAQNAYVAGFAQTFDFPTTPGAYQANIGSASSGAFLTKLNPTGSALVYSTVLAGSCYDGATGVAVDAAGNAYVTGAASSYNFPTTKGAFQRLNNANPASAGCQPSSGIYNAFVTKFNPAGSALIFSTLLGGSVGDQSEGIAIDVKGNSYVAGYAGSPDFPLTGDALQTVNSSGGGFVTGVNATGSALLYSTFIGGTGSTYSGFSPTAPNGIAIDSTEGVYITGQTSSTNFPVTSQPLQPALKDEYSNAFISKFALNTKGDATSLRLSSNMNPQPAGKPVTITVHVEPLSGNGIPTGTVSGSANGSTLVTETLDSSGSATFLNSNPESGIYTLVATYSGDNTYAPTSGDFQQVVSGGAGGIAPYISCGATYGAVNQCRLAAAVTDVFGNPLAGASVHFSSSGLKFASPTVVTDASGVATVQATATQVGQLVADATVEGVSYAAVFNVTATPALLTVAAKSITVPYNQAIPALGYAVTGFVNGDKSTVLTGTAGESTTAVKGAPAGIYPITLSKGTLAAKNYTFKLVNGTVTITSQQ